MRNAGQSDPTERERGGWRGKTSQERHKKKRNDKVAQIKSQGSTLHVFVSVKIQSHCLWKEWRVMEQITLFS